MSKPKISVLNITARHGGIDILWADMRRQTEQDFELVIVDGLWRERENEVKEYINDPRLVYIRQSDKREGAHTNLAHADNEGFKACNGELIVCLQDFIWIPHDGLEKYWFHYVNEPTTLVTGVGHQYSDPSPVDNNGKITVFSEPYRGKPSNMSWVEPRMAPGVSLRYGEPVEWEMNYCSLPKKIIYDLGGMDEHYDFEGFAFDNTNIATRASFLGSKILIDQTNECMGFNHDAWWPNPLKVNRISPIKYHIEQMTKMYNKEIPIRLPYLD